MFFGFWERGSAEKSEGIMGSNTFDPDTNLSKECEEKINEEK